MDQVLQWLNTGLYVLLAGFFALVPGIVVWLAVFGVGLLARSLKRYSLFRRPQLGNESALACRLTETG